MIEFKFACTKCGQHIQANDAYSGRQISCPACQHQIVVPQAPASAAAPRATIAVASPPPAQHGAAPMEPVSSPPPVHGHSKTKWMVTWTVAGLIVLGAVGYAFLFGPLSKSERSASIDPTQANAAGKAGRDGRSEATPTLSAAEIIEKVRERYDSLTNFSATGKSVALIDMSAVDPGKMPGVTPEAPRETQESKEFKQAMAKPQRLESDFSVKLGKPNFYRVEWEGQMGPTKNKGAVWSSGNGDFLFMGLTPAKYVKMQNRELALGAATGVSGGVAGTLPGVFFKDPSNPLDLLQNPVVGAGEAIDGEDCHVLNGDAMGLKTTLWITKSHFLIKQKQTELGGKVNAPELTESQIQEGVRRLGGQPASQQEGQIKAMLRSMQAMTSKLKGTITETYQNIEINRPVAKEDFNFTVPAGTRLSSSLF